MKRKDNIKKIGQYCFSIGFLKKFGQFCFSIGFIYIAFRSRPETPGLKSVSSDAINQSSEKKLISITGGDSSVYFGGEKTELNEPINKIPSLKNEFEAKENKVWTAIKKCTILRQNEISYVDSLRKPYSGLTVRSNNFSIYKFKYYADGNNFTIGSSCWEKRKYEFNKVYTYGNYGSRQIEFFKALSGSEIHAYKKENSSVEKIWVFKVYPEGRFISNSFGEELVK